MDKKAKIAIGVGAIILIGGAGLLIYRNRKRKAQAEQDRLEEEKLIAELGIDPQTGKPSVKTPNVFGGSIGSSKEDIGSLAVLSVVGGGLLPTTTVTLKEDLPMTVKAGDQVILNVKDAPNKNTRISKVIDSRRIMVGKIPTSIKTKITSIKLLNQ